MFYVCFSSTRSLELWGQRLCLLYKHHPSIENGNKSIKLEEWMNKKDTNERSIIMVFIKFLEYSFMYRWINSCTKVHIRKHSEFSWDSLIERSKRQFWRRQSLRCHLCHSLDRQAGKERYINESWLSSSQFSVLSHGHVSWPYLSNSLFLTITWWNSRGFTRRPHYPLV